MSDTITDQEVEQFLAHHGVKGQKWGIRNRVSSGKKKTVKFVKAHQHGIILGAKVALAAAAVAATLHAEGKYKVKDIPHASSYTKHAGTVEDLIHAEHAKQASSLLRMHQEGKMDKNQYAHFKKILDARYARKIMDAA